VTLYDFLANFGFEADPFESTNAETEERLQAYFVPPPFFTSILGDPDTPASQIVFAPRGSGKTAQRRMIESYSETADFVCITYDHFDMPPGFTVDTADLNYHLNQLCRLLVLAILAHLEEQPWQADMLTEQQRQLLKYDVTRFLGSLSPQEFQEAVRSIKSLGDRAGDLWRKYGGPLAVALQALLNKAGLEGVNIPAEIAAEVKRDETLRYHFETLLAMLVTLGYRSTYILVDKVDETFITASDAESTFYLIRALLLDLPTLEMFACGFKFFLWDHIATAYLDQGGRPDRVQVFRLSWSVSELQNMLEQRLSAFSNATVRTLDSLMCADVNLDVDLLVAYLAFGSPRDVIRLAKTIVDEQLRLSSSDTCIQENAIWNGVRRFSDQRAQELAGDHLSELRKVGQPTFTINYVANDVYHVSHEAARSRIQKWSQTGVVQQIGEVPNPPNRPLHLYGIVDPRVAIAAFTTIDVPTVLGNYVVMCPECGALQVSGEINLSCTNCGRAFELSSSKSLLEAVSG
jgi:hypothetical protein